MKNSFPILQYADGTILNEIYFLNGFLVYLLDEALSVFVVTHPLVFYVIFIIVLQIKV